MRVRAIAVGRLMALMTLACLWNASGVQAAILSTPGGLNPGDEFRFIFVTSTTTQATNSSAAYYDGIAQTDGNSLLYDDNDPDLVAEIFQWFALVSTTDQSANQIVTENDIPIYLITGALVATGASDLWNGSIAAAIDVTESLDPYDGHVWTGSNSDGSAALFGYVMGAGSVGLGNVSFTDPLWFSDGAGSPSLFRPVYAISQILTAPSFAGPSVPEPTSLAMLAMAGVGVLGGRSLRRRKMG